MAQIDSGLGWSCDEDYYFPDAGKIVELSSGGTITKSVGGAICGIIRDSNNGYYSCYVLSTEQNNVEVSVADGMVIAADKVSKTTAYGVWYLSLCYKDQSSSWESQSVPFVGSFASPTAEYAIEKILEAANLMFDEKITTDSYVKGYVEGVVRENNKRMVTPDVLGAPLFSASRSYAVNDYVIKDGKLYKCTSAHTGDWNAGDFTQTNLLSIIAET